MRSGECGFHAQLLLAYNIYMYPVFDSNWQLSLNIFDFRFLCSEQISIHLN